MKTETQIRSEIEELEKIKTNLDNHTEVHEALIKKKSELKGYLLAKKEMIDDEIYFIERILCLPTIKAELKQRLSDLKEVQKNGN